MNTAMDNCEATDEAISAYQNVSANSEEIANAARDSLDFLAALAVPQVYKYTFPDVLLSAWDF